MKAARIVILALIVASLVGFALTRATLRIRGEYSEVKRDRSVREGSRAGATMMTMEWIRLTFEYYDTRAGRSPAMQDLLDGHSSYWQEVAKDRLSLRDAWGNEIVMYGAPLPSDEINAGLIVSAGPDGVFAPEGWSRVGECTEAADDLVLTTSGWTRWEAYDLPPALRDCRSGRLRWPPGSAPGGPEDVEALIPQSAPRLAAAYMPEASSTTQGIPQSRSALVARTMERLVDVALTIEAFQERAGRAVEAADLEDPASAFNRECGGTAIAWEDDWGGPIIVAIRRHRGLGPKYLVISAGEDGSVDRSQWSGDVGFGVVGDDLVLSEGGWVRARDVPSNVRWSECSMAEWDWQRSAP